MWYSDYIVEIKRQFVEVFGLEPLEKRGKEYILKVPDGEYSMTIDGKIDNVKIVNGYIHCCNFESS